MGRYNFAAQRVHQHATQLIERSRLPAPPPWFSAISSTPPAARLVRPPLRQGNRQVKKSKSRMFQPARISYEEDRLRWDYFNDHPWDLARPRIVLENDGRDLERHDWSVELDVALNAPPQRSSGKDRYGRDHSEWEQTWASQCTRPLNGESVVQRQNWLMRERQMKRNAAYDTARKEYYRIRHFREIERRVAHEEALAMGASFGMGPLEVGMHLEDQQYEKWKLWATQEAEKLRQLSMQGTGAVDADEEEGEEEGGQDASEGSEGESEVVIREQ